MNGLTQPHVNPNQSSIDQTRHLLEEARVANNKDVVIKTTFFLLDQYLTNQDYEEALALIHKCIEEQWVEEYSALMKLADKYVQMTLQMEDFEEMERALSFREGFLGYFPKEEIMQSFYRSVALEGQKRYPQAIEALYAVPDTLSNSNLTSKYLKLAMLYLKVGQVKLALDSLEQAKRFDPNQKNEIFALVETDVALHEGKFQEAKYYFERFFLKTKQKSRYLDRLIDIYLGLEEYGEAKHFIEEYLPKVHTLQSKSYRLQFYEAVKRYAQKTKDQELVHSCNEWIHSLTKLVHVTHTLDSDLSAFLTKNQTQDRLRDILLAFFQTIEPHVEGNRFDFIEVIPEGMQVYHYASKRLYERRLSYENYLQTALHSFSIQNHPFSVLQSSDMDNIDYWTSGALLREDQIALIRVIPWNESIFGYLVSVVNLAQDYTKLFQDFERAASMLSLKLFCHLQKQEMKNRLDIFEHSFEHHQIGFIRIANHYLFLLNQAAKTILEESSDILSYESFQGRILEPKVVYLDQIYAGSVPNLTIRTKNNQAKILNVHRFVAGDIIYLTIIGQSNPPKTPVQEQRFANHPSLKHVLQTLQPPCSFLLIESRLLEVSDWRIREAFHNQIIQFIHKAALEQKMKLQTIEGFGYFVILHTLDKRIVNRIARQVELWIQDEVAFQIPTIPKIEIKMICSTLSKERSSDSLLDAIDVHLSAHRSDGVQWIEKDTYEQIAFQNAQRMRLEEWIQSERIPIHYGIYGDLSLQQIAFIHSQAYDPFAKDINVEATLKKYQLEEKLDQVFFKQVLKEMDQFYKATRQKIPFFIFMHQISIAKHMVHRLFITEAKRRKIPLELIILGFELEEKPHPIILQECLALSEKGFKIALRVNMDRSIKQLRDYSFVDYLVLTEESWIVPLQWLQKPILFLKQHQDVLDEAALLKHKPILPISNPVMYQSLTEVIERIQKTKQEEV